MFDVGDAVIFFEGDASREILGMVIGVYAYRDNGYYLVLADDGMELWRPASKVRIAQGHAQHDEDAPMFSVGDVVTLRSGGPRMTVAQLNGGEIGCAWFDGSGESLRREYFPAECLKKVTNEP